jgi:hypothetical protein
MLRFHSNFFNILNSDVQVSNAEGKRCWVLLRTLVTRTGHGVAWCVRCVSFFKFCFIYFVYVEVFAVLNLLSKCYVSLVILLVYQVDRLVADALVAVWDCLQERTPCLRSTNSLPLELYRWFSVWKWTRLSTEQILVPVTYFCRRSSLQTCFCRVVTKHDTRYRNEDILLLAHDWFCCQSCCLVTRTLYEIWLVT